MNDEQRKRLRLAIGAPSAYGLLSGVLSATLPDPLLFDPALPQYVVAMAWAALVCTGYVMLGLLATVVRAWIMGTEPDDYKMLAPWRKADE